ncbi:MAG: hypothetical protein ACJAY3_001289 [Neolewinella sp.]|jgi:hypothetical protein
MSEHKPAQYKEEIHSQMALIISPTDDLFIHLDSKN